MVGLSAAQSNNSLDASGTSGLVNDNLTVTWLSPAASTQTLCATGYRSIEAMGTDFTAVVNHNLNGHDIHSLPDLLNSKWRSIEHLLPVIEGYPVPGSSPAEWQWGKNDGGFNLDRLHNHGTIRIESHEFTGSVSERVFRLYHGIRWWSFLSEQAVRNKLRSVCRHVSAVLGSSQIIYLPDGFLKPEGAIGLIYEGKAVEDMIDWLLENCGPPVPSIESIYSGTLESWNANGYYIERI